MGGRGDGAVGEGEGDEGVEDEGDQELRWLVGVSGVSGGRGQRGAGQTICFLCSGVWRSICIRWTLEGSSWGSSGWRAAGAVVNGVGMAFELVLTAAAGLAKDFAARLLTAIVGP